MTRPPNLVGDRREARSVRLNYYTRIPNVGDLANPTIVEGVSQIPARRVELDAGPHLLAVGSVISAARPDSRVWGAGLMHPKYGFGQLRAENVWAVRGKKTIEELSKQQAGVPDMPFGDPGILLPDVLNIAPHPEPTYPIGIAAHYVDRKDPRVLALLAEDGVLDLNVHQEPRAFMEQMAKCAVVVSSSLHGIIFAEALGLPNLWTKVTDKVAGEGFKFQDWYTTTARPQKAPHILGADERVSDLISKCEIRETIVDKTALAAALCPERLEVVRDSDTRSFFPVETCRSMPTPCFVISFNRGHFLKKTIDGLRKQNRNMDFVVHDNGSTDPETLDVLAELEAEGIIVNRQSPISSANDLNKVNDSVQAYFRNWAEPQRYIVTDCDIDMSEARSDAIEVFDAALNCLTDLEAVGPMLRIADIPLGYPLRNHALNLHISQFWGKVPEMFKYGAEQLALLRCPIDTTLALHRAGEPFRRLKKSARFYAPHEATHLDWYITVGQEEGFGTDEGAHISHWGNSGWLKAHGGASLKYPGFFDIERISPSQCKVIWLPFDKAPLGVRHRLMLARLKHYTSKLKLADS